ncbi:MAG: VCBS repeat-containing protein [Planctomycetes bacterium]|nr:VCBS repeat-containing protein [Planctomycetota bacterium]
MSARPLKFRHEVIDADPPGSEHDIVLVADLTGNGRNDIIIGSKKGPPNLFWYENPTWRRHAMAEAPGLEAGGVVFDVNRDGRPDVVAGQQYNGNELYWFECPDNPRKPWTRRVIEDRFRKYHDQAIGDVDNDGEPELVFVSQLGGVLAYYDIPDNPRVEPWPRECFHLIADGVSDKLEGLAVVDIDGDGRLELLAGPNIWRCDGPGGAWRVESFADGFVMTRVAAADLDGDGSPEIVLCEGESRPGRLVWCKGPDWRPRILRDDLFHPHSLAIADFDGDGRPDIFVGEMGLGKNPEPKMLIFRNLGRAAFEEVLVQQGIPTHEAKAADLTGNGLPDIIGKPYHPERHIDVWFNES